MPIIRDLGDCLILRRSRREDRERVAEFHANTLLEVDETPPLERLYYWILDLLSSEHPHFNVADFTIVEDTRTGKIVSSVAHTSQTWTYEGIPFKFGQPDCVSTDPAYRRRGLVHAQMEEVHRWSAERGELVQGITGIPWFYRQYGYEFALSLDAYRLAYRANVPGLEEGQQETFRFRPAALADIPFLMEMHAQACARSIVAAQRDEAYWRFDLAQRHERNGQATEVRIIEAADNPGEPLGALTHARRLWGTQLGLRFYEVRPGVPMLATVPGALRYLDQTGEAFAAREGGSYDAIHADLGETHPLYDSAPQRFPGVGQPYAWYLRAPDLAAFLRHIAPALERRLAASPQSGYSGEFNLNFYRSGLGLRFSDGRLTIADWAPERVESGDACFPGHTFLQLLFGYRTMQEVQHAHADCLINTDAAHALLPVLFPKRPAFIWPVT